METSDAFRLAVHTEPRSCETQLAPLAQFPDGSSRSGRFANTDGVASSVGNACQSDLALGIVLDHESSTVQIDNVAESGLQPIQRAADSRIIGVTCAT